MAPKRKVTSRRRAKQFSLPFPLTQAQQATYRSPHWQERVNVYAQNYLLPVELSHCRQLGLRFLPMEAEIVQRQLLGTPSLMRKVQELIGSLYVYDAAYALMREMREQMENVLAADENVKEELVVNLMNNIRGYSLVALDTPGPAGGAVVATIGGNPYRRVPTPVDVSTNLTVLSPSQENSIRTKGYVQLEGGLYTVQRVPDRAAPGLGRDGMMPYAITADGEFAVESCINMLIELANSKEIDTNLFSVQSRAAVFYPLGLERESAQAMYTGTTQMRGIIDQGGMQGQHNLMTNVGGRAGTAFLTPPTPALGGAMGQAGRDAGTGGGHKFDNVLRKISVPPSATGLARTMNAAVLEVQKMTLTQRDLLAEFGQWVSSGMGILALDNVPFDQYLNPGAVGAPGNAYSRNVMGNKPRTMKYLEANYTNDSCGQGFKRLWYTDDPAKPKARMVPGYLPSSKGGMVKNPEARVAVCAPFSQQRGALPIGRGDETFTDMTYAVRPRGAVAAQRRKRATPATKKRKPAAKTTRRK